jgi:hypothetical protein
MAGANSEGAVTSEDASVNETSRASSDVSEVCVCVRERERERERD